MLVKELIASLQKINPEATLVILDHSGYDLYFPSSIVVIEDAEFNMVDIMDEDGLLAGEIAGEEETIHVCTLEVL